QGPDRPLRRGQGAAVARRRLRRRVRGADPGRRGPPHRQVGVHGPVRLRRDSEGAAMIRSKGEAGTGNVVEATRHMRSIRAGIRRLTTLAPDELYGAAKELRAPYELVAEVAGLGKLPVVLFTAGGIATPADAAMMMQLGAEGVFVGSGIFKSGDPAKRAEAIVK